MRYHPFTAKTRRAPRISPSRILSRRAYSLTRPVTSLCAVQDKLYWLGCAPARRHSQLDCDTVEKPKGYDVRNAPERYSICAAGCPLTKALLLRPTAVQVRRDHD